MIKLRSVTWYSQLVAILLAVSIFLLGMYVGGKTNTAKAPIENGRDKNVLPTSLTDDSNAEAVLTGYYEKYESGYFSGPVECNTLVLVSGQNDDTDFVNLYINKVLRKNTVQSLTPSGELRINLPWDDISELDRQAIIESTQDNLVSLRLKQKKPEERGAPPCYSFLEYLEVVR